jgi:YidC/Oxa1 family membrane protein insertase
MMDFMMPLMSVYIAFIVPAAVGIYWMFKSVLGTVKQLIMKKAMPIPVFTEADYKAAEKEMYGKNPPKAHKASGSGNPNVRSLHHIDDDEYDAKGNYIGRSEQAEQEAEAAQSKKDQKAPAMAEPLKDESDKKQNDADSDRTTNS